MKNSKKLLILVLSLVLLIGVFAVMAAAEDGASSDVLTIQYPDGTVQTYAEGEPILPPVLPKEFVWIDDDGKGYKYTVTGSAWEGIPAAVTSENLGTTVKATVAGTKGTEQVYFVTWERLTQEGPFTVVYHFNNNVHQYLSTSNKGDKGDGTNTGAHSAQDLGSAGSNGEIRIKLYWDVNVSSFSMNIMPSPRKSQGVPTYLDLNGHTVTTTQTSYINSQAVKIHIYSSVPGAHWYQTQSSTMFRANDDTTFYLGSQSEVSNFGDEGNISFHCKGISGDQYGGGLGIYGGKYYQTGVNSEGGMLNLNRRINALQDAEFYCLANSYPIVDVSSSTSHYAIGSGSGTVKNCKFYTPSAINFIKSDKVTKFGVENCTFINAVPDVASLPAGSAVTFKTGNVTTSAVAGNLGTASAPIVAAKVDPFAIQGLVAVDGTPIAATANYRLLNKAETLEVVVDGKASYWGIGATFPRIAEGIVQVTEDGILSYNGEYDITGIAQIADGKVVAAGAVNVPVRFLDSVAVAFTYETAGTLKYVALDDKTAEEIGQAFHETFAELNFAANIKMYADFVIPAAMGWGPTFTNDNKVLEHKSLAGGNVTLDLNGHTMSIPALTEGINLSNSNSLGSYPHSSEVIFGFEQGAAKTFTLTSSRAGAKVLNASELALLGVGEQDVNHIVIEGDITYIGKGAITHAFEVHGSNAPKLTVNGGTFIIESNRPAFSFQSVATIKDAKIVLLGDAPVAVFGVHTYKRNASFTVENTVFYSKNEAKIFSFIGTTYGASANPGADMNFVLTLENCSFSGINLEKNANLDTYTISGQMKADSENALLALYGGTKPSGKIAAKYVVDLNGNIVTFYGYGSASEYTTVSYGDFAPIEYYLLGSLLKPVDPATLKAPYYQLSYGIYVAVEGYKGALGNAFVTSDMLNNRYDAISNINYVEYPLAYVVLNADVPVAHGLLASDDIGADLAASLAAAADGAEIRFYTDIAFASFDAFAPSVKLNLNGYGLLVSEFICNQKPITVENGLIVYFGGWNSLFHNGASLKDVSLYNFGDREDACITQNTGLSIEDSWIYNFIIGDENSIPFEPILIGTVFHTDENVDGVTLNNYEEYVTVYDETFEVVYTRATTDDPSLVADVTFTYKGEVMGTESYFVGSIPGFYLEAADGYYYLYETEDPIYESAELPLVFMADESKLKAQVVVTDALNFIFYLQKQEGLSNLVFCGEAMDLSALAIETFDGVEYYVIPAAFATFADCLNPATLSVDVSFGENTETVTASVSLLNYATLLLADEAATYEDKALVYALLEYVDAIIEYFAYDVENDIPALLNAYSEYATEYVAKETEQITSDFIRGVLYIVDEQVSLALRVDPDFKGEIILSVPGEEGTVATFIYKDIVEIDGSTYVILEDIPFSALDAGYEINVKMYGELLETFTYSIADYANAMTVQNMGYVPAYARALSIFATLAAAYVA